MTNEQYLITSYFAVAVGAVVLALLTWLILRRLVREIADQTGRRGLAVFLCRILPTVLVLMALSGFCSVIFYNACSHHETYAQIVADRAYLEGKTCEQVAAVTNWLIAVVFVWGFVMLIILIAVERQRSLPKT